MRTTMWNIKQMDFEKFHWVNRIKKTLNCENRLCIREKETSILICWRKFILTCSVTIIFSLDFVKNCYLRHAQHTRLTWYIETKIDCFWFFAWILKETMDYVQSSVCYSSAPKMHIKNVLPMVRCTLSAVVVVVVAAPNLLVFYSVSFVRLYVILPVNPFYF